VIVLCVSEITRKYYAVDLVLCNQVLYEWKQIEEVFISLTVGEVEIGQG
jgi:hypothetical protein